MAIVDVDAHLKVLDGVTDRDLEVEDFQTSRTGAATQATLEDVRDLLSQAQRSALVIQAVAGSVLSGYRVVTTEFSGRVVYASSDASAEGPFWLTTTAAVEDELVQLVAVGEVVDPGWAWTARQPVYLHANGQISHVIPVLPETFLVQIGVALTATSIFVDPQVPVVLG